MAGWTDEQIKGLFERLDDIQWRTREVHAVSLMRHWRWAPDREGWDAGSGEQVFPGVYARIGPGTDVKATHAAEQELGVVAGRDPLTIPADQWDALLKVVAERPDNPLTAESVPALKAGMIEALRDLLGPGA